MVRVAVFPAAAAAVVGAGMGMLVSLRSFNAMYFIFPDTWSPFGTSR